MSFDLLYFGVLRISLVNKTRVIPEIFSIYPVLYTCPNGGYLNGVSSVHDNKNEDGRYRFRCCTPKSGKYFPHILFFKTTEEFKMVFFSLLLVFVLWYYFACRLLMAEMLQKRCNLWINQWISLSIFLKDITQKNCRWTGWVNKWDFFLTTSFHLVTLSGVWIAFTTKKVNYDIDRTNIIEWFEYESYKTETEKNP